MAQPEEQQQRGKVQRTDQPEDDRLPRLEDASEDERPGEQLQKSDDLTPRYERLKWAASVK